VLSLNSIKDLIEKHSASLSIISMQGGEPFLWNDLQSLMTWIKNTYPKIKVAVVTNLGRTPSWVLEDNPFDRIKVSLDGVGPIAESTRSGTNWLVVKSNLRKLLKTHKPVVSTTISVLNLQGLAELSEFLKEHDITDHLDSNIVMTPGYLSICNLPQHLKDEYLSLNYGLYDSVVKKALQMSAFMDHDTMRTELRKLNVLNFHKNCPILYGWVGDSFSENEVSAQDLS
jgi:MoaA/NifB/PqqE/SkfB family radical SAM enzyme